MNTTSAVIRAAVAALLVLAPGADPAGEGTVDLTADGLGDWAFHCHMLLHMMSGMFRVVTVRHEEDAA